MKNIISRLLMMGSLVTLTACGGGGGDDSSDTTAPTVSSTSPIASATDVAISSSVTATFNEDVFATTVDTSSFTVKNSANVTGTVSFDGNTNIATFTPGNDLALLASHTATLSTTITDLAGNALVANYNWSFTTVDGAWKSTVLIETDNAGDAREPQIAIDSNGNALAVWWQFDGTRNNIWSNRYVASTGLWSNAGLIETSTAVAFNPQIAIDSNGNALAVWWQFDGTAFSIYSNRYVASAGSWDGAALDIEAGAGDAREPQIAIDSNGNALAVWKQHDGTRYNIYSNRYVASAGLWDGAALIEANAGDARGPQIAIDSNGNALAVWEQHDGTRYNIWSNRYVASTGLWSVAALIEVGNAGDAFFPQIAIDSNGNALAVWEKFDGTRKNIWSNRYVASTGLWSNAGLIETDNAGDAREPQIAIDSNGNALAVWWQFDGTAFSIYSNRYVASAGSWDSAALIEANAGDARGPQIAIDSNGNALAVWEQHDGTRYNIWSNRYVASTGLWSNAGLIETDNAGHASTPQIAVDSNGNALAVWHHNDSIRQNIWSNRFE